PATVLALEHSAKEKVVAALARETDAKNDARRERDAAAANYHRALEAIDVFLHLLARDRLKQLPQTETLRHEMLQEATRFYASLLDEGHRDPALKRDTAYAEASLAGVELLLGRADETRARTTRQIAGFDAQLARDPGDVDVRF